MPLLKYLPTQISDKHPIICAFFTRQQDLTYAIFFIRFFFTVRGWSLVVGRVLEGAFLAALLFGSF